MQQAASSGRKQHCQRAWLGTGPPPLRNVSSQHALALGSLSPPEAPPLTPLSFPTSPHTSAQLGNDYDGFRNTYSEGPQHNQPKRRAANATGGLPLGSAAAAVAAAGALAGPALQRCELCAATFGSERELALHLDGAAHKQAVARAEAEAERRRRLGAYADVAASAVQAAVWQSGGSGGRPAQRPPPPSAAAATGGNAAALGGSGGGSSGAPAAPPQQGGRGGGGRGRGGDPQQQQQQGRGRGQPQQPAQPAVHARDLTSHAEMLKQARGGDKAPLDLDGWVPPTVPQPAAPAAAVLQGQQQAQQGTVADGAEQQADAEQQAGLLGGLVSYGEEDAEETAAEQGTGAPQPQQAQQQAASSASDGSSSDSDSEGGGGGAPAAFFTF